MRVIDYVFPEKNRVRGRVQFDSVLIKGAGGNWTRAEVRGPTQGKICTPVGHPGPVSYRINAPTQDTFEFDISFDDGYVNLFVFDAKVLDGIGISTFEIVGYCNSNHPSVMTLKDALIEVAFRLITGKKDAQHHRFRVEPAGDIDVDIDSLLPRLLARAILSIRSDFDTHDQLFREGVYDTTIPRNILSDDTPRKQGDVARVAGFNVKFDRWIVAERVIRVADLKKADEDFRHIPLEISDAARCLYKEVAKSAGDIDLRGAIVFATAGDDVLSERFGAKVCSMTDPTSGVTLTLSVASVNGEVAWSLSALWGVAEPVVEFKEVA